MASAEWAYQCPEMQKTQISPFTSMQSDHCVDTALLLFPQYQTPFLMVRLKLTCISFTDTVQPEAEHLLIFFDAVKRLPLT